MSTLKLHNFTSYNELIISQEDMVFFQIIEEEKTKDHKYRDSRLAWKKFQDNLSQPQGLPRQDYARNLLSANYVE